MATSPLLVFLLTLSSPSIARWFLLSHVFSQLRSRPLTSQRAITALLVTLLAFYQPLVSGLVPEGAPLWQLGHILQALVCATLVTMGWTEAIASVVGPALKELVTVGGAAVKEGITSSMDVPANIRALGSVNLTNSSAAAVDQSFRATASVLEGTSSVLEGAASVLQGTASILQGMAKALPTIILTSIAAAVFVVVFLTERRGHPFIANHGRAGRVPHPHIE